MIMIEVQQNALDNFMVCKAFGLLKERIKTFSFNVERLKKLEHAINGELRSNSYTKKVPLIKRLRYRPPM